MKIILLRPHNHAGRELRPGEVIDMPPVQAAWMIARAIAVPEKTAMKRPRKTPTHTD